MAFACFWLMMEKSMKIMYRNGWLTRRANIPNYKRHHIRSPVRCCCSSSCMAQDVSKWICVFGPHSQGCVWVLVPDCYIAKTSPFQIHKNSNQYDLLLNWKFRLRSFANNIHSTPNKWNYFAFFENVTIIFAFSTIFCDENLSNTPKS